MKKLKGYFFLLLRIGITAGILYFLLKKSDFQRLWEIFKHVAVGYYLIALVCFFGFQAFVALRWKLICKIWGFESNYSFYLKTYLMSFSLNTVMPGTVGGDFLRIVLLSKRGLQWKKASLSVFYDRFFGFLGIFFLLAGFVPIWGKFLPHKLYEFLLILNYGVIVGGCLILLVFKNWFKNEYFKPVVFPYNLKPLFLGIVVQTLLVFEFFFLAKALHLKVKLLHFFVIIPVISFLSALPISISGLGVREGGLSYFLHLLNYSIEYGISIGFLAYSLILICAIPGLVIYLKEKKLWK